VKTVLIYTIIGLLAINSLTAQVKIGDNPQNLNPASLLELESTSRALVISRVTDAQMSAISPLRGALVYNTDQNCLHYYDGTAWINICEALDDSFTTSTEDGTIVITQDGDNYDFSVGLIDSSNIPRNSIEGSDIAPGVIDSQHYANNSINPEEHFNGLASNTRQIIIWNGTDWVYTLESDLQISEADGVIGNEVVDVTDGTLTRSGNGDAGDPYTLGVSPLGITENELANDAVTSNKILNGTILDEDIANDAVTNEKIDASVVGTGLLQNASGALEVNNSVIEPDWINIDNIPTDIADGDDDTTNFSLTEDGTDLILEDSDGNTVTIPLADIQIPDTNTTNFSLTEDGTDLILEDSDGNTVTIPLADIQIPDTNTTNFSLTEDGTDLILEDSDGNTVTIPLADIQQTNTTNFSLTEDGTDLILEDSDGNTVTIPLADIQQTNTTLATNDITQTDIDRTYNIGGIGSTLSFTNGSIGVGATTPTPPTSTLQTEGSFSAPIRSENTGSVVINETDYTIIISGTVTDIELPDPIGIRGRIYIIKNIIAGSVSSNRPFFDITGAGTTFFPNGVTMIQSDGNNWHKINN